MSPEDTPSVEYVYLEYMHVYIAIVVESHLFLLHWCNIYILDLA